MSGRDRKADVLRLVRPSGSDVIVGIDAENPDGEFVRFRLADLFSDQVADISDMEVRKGDGEEYRPLREWIAAIGTGGSEPVAWTDISGKPTAFTPSAHGHTWNEISDKPAFFDGTWSSLSGKPTFSAVASSGSYNDLTDKPTLFSGAYADLAGKPTIPAGLDDLSDVNLSGAVEGYTLKLIGGVWVPAPDNSGEGGPVTVAWADVTGKPTFATVATSGSYADLADKPTLFDGTWSSLSGKPTLFDGTWDSLSGKPLTFEPSAHSHATSEITGLDSALAAKAPASAAVPIGAGMDFWGATPPAGWVFAAGQELSRTTYAALDALFGTTYGAYTNGSGAAGTTHFRMPDKRERLSLAKGDMGGTASPARVTAAGSNITPTTLGNAGGSQFMPTHNHKQQSINSVAPATGTNGTQTNINTGTVWYVVEAADSTARNTSSTGTGGSGNMPPVIVCNYIIYAGV